MSKPSAGITAVVIRARQDWANVREIGSAKKMRKKRNLQVLESLLDRYSSGILLFMYTDSGERRATTSAAGK